MKFFVLSFLVFAVISECYGSLSIELIPKNAEYPGKCYVKKYKMALVMGDTYQVPDSCADMICNESYELTYLGCLPLAGCPDDWITKLVSGDETKRYPGCCDSNECYKPKDQKNQEEPKKI